MGEVKSVTDSLDLLPDAIIIVDSKGIIVDHNRMTETMFLYPDGLVGKPLEVLIPERIRNAHAQHLTKFYQNPHSRKMGAGMKLLGRRADGTEIEVDIALSHIGKGKENLTVAVIRDITDKILLERKIGTLSRVKEELERFSYVVSHDLKAPLKRLQSLSHLLLLELRGYENEEVRNMLGHIHSSVTILEKLIQGILDYAVLELEDEWIKTDLNETFSQVTDTIDVPAGFKIELPRPLPVVYGNETKFFQIFLNLITNAIKYNDKKEGKLQINWVEWGDVYQFTFSDNGKTIPSEYREAVFKAYKSVGKFGDKDSHGLGLSIVKRIIDQSGGNIFCQGSALGGSEFVFTWPKNMPVP